MSGIIDGEIDAGGLPPPMLMSMTNASQLAFVLQGERAGPFATQLIASRNGEGVSTIARDICLVSAANGHRTLLLAAEWPGRRTDWPRSIYGMPAGLRGFADGPATLEMVRVGDTPLVLAAPVATPPLQAPPWMAMLSHLRSLFDFIVVDSPALERSYTGVMLAPHVDATAIVVAAESTRASTARSLRDRLVEAGAEMVGVILNKRRFHVPRAAYERL